jgi:hypothetical protein
MGSCLSRAVGRSELVTAVLLKRERLRGPLTVAPWGDRICGDRHGIADPGAGFVKLTSMPCGRNGLLGTGGGLLLCGALA